jgi:hypothetical protein
MDNKITKRRLSNFLAYEWIMIIIVALAAIVVWEFVYGIVSVKPTTGQQFKIYYDEGMAYSSGRLMDLLDEDDTLSYDVLDLDVEELIKDNNVLSTRLSVYEGDIIISNGIADEETGAMRAKAVVDSTAIYSLEELLEDAKSYLREFLKDEDAPENAELDFDNLDEDKIKAHFLERMDGDNRFRKEEQKADGVEKEKARIEKLCKDTKDFEYFLLNAPEGALFRYTRYEQSANDDLPEYYSDMFEEAYILECEERPNAIYGINAGALKGGKTDPSTFFKVGGESTAEGAIVMCFNFLAHQPDLQFECISFYCTIIRECSDILS